jgi:hypothetical protein
MSMMSGHGARRAWCGCGPSKIVQDYTSNTRNIVWEEGHVLVSWSGNLFVCHLSAIAAASALLKPLIH